MLRKRTSLVVIGLALAIVAGYGIAQVFITPQGQGVEGMERMELSTLVARDMAGVYKDPAATGTITIGGLMDDVRRETGDQVTDLEKTLETTKSLPLRNAIHLRLKDLYKVQGQTEKVLATLHTIIDENDKAPQNQK